MSTTRICQNPACCAEFVPARWTRRYCCQGCAQQASKQAFSDPAILPAETKPGRSKPMTQEEFTAELAKDRKKLDSKPPHPGDRWWRREEIAVKVRTDWTVGQMARYYRVEVAQMQRLVDAVLAVEVAA